MNPVQVVQQQNLTVALATIARFGSFCRFAHLDNDHVSGVPLAKKTYLAEQAGHIRDDVAFEFVEPRIHFAIVDLFGAFTDRFEKERLRVKFRIDP